MPHRVTIVPKPDITVASNTDEYGNLTEAAWSASATASGVTCNARVLVRTGSEERNRREVNQYTLNVILPSTAEVTNRAPADGDRITFKGEDYYIDSVLLVYNPLNGSPHHFRVGTFKAD